MLPLWRVEPRQLRDADVVVARQRLQQLLEAAPPALDRGRIEQRGGIAQRADDAGIALFQGQVQIELEHGQRLRYRLQLQSGQLELALAGGGGGALPGEHGLEHRVMGQVACRIERGNELLEGQVLMLLSRQCGGTHLGKQLGDRRIGAQIDAQRLGVDEQADQRLQFAAGAVGDRCADDHLILASQARQQHAPGGEQGHEHSGAVALAQRLQRRSQLGIEGEPHCIAAMVLQRRAGPIGGQLQQRWRVVQVLDPDVALTLQHLALEPAALPDGDVGVL